MFEQILYQFSILYITFLFKLFTSLTSEATITLVGVIITSILTVLGWNFISRNNIAAQDKLQKDQINYEIYNVIVNQLDQYFAELSEYQSILNGIHYSGAWEKEGQLLNKSTVWFGRATTAGLNIKYHLLLQKWETYEIFLQFAHKIRDNLSVNHDKIMNDFREHFLYRSSEKNIVQDREAYINEISLHVEDVTEQIIFLLDTKKALQNHFFKKYDLSELPPRKPKDKDKLVLTLEGWV